jgi:hypothetical protein
MLSEGHSQEKADQEIGDLFKLLGLVQSATLKVNQPDTQLRVTFDLRFDQAAPAADTTARAGGSTAGDSSPSASGNK